MLIKKPFKKGMGTSSAPYYAVAGGDAAQTTAFLARTSGLSGTETNAYKALINGLVSDGNFALLDALYIFATNTTTTANLNLISTSFGLTKTGTVTFAADVGYTGDGSTGFLDTGFIPQTGGTNFVLNSASMGSYILTNRAANTSIIMSNDNAVTFDIIQPFSAGNVVQWDVNDATFPTAAIASSRQALAITRTASNATAVYANGNTTAIGTSAAASVGPLSGASMVFFARNSNGTKSAFSSDQAAAFFFGGALTATQSVAINNRINTYMTALGINVY